MQFKPTHGLSRTPEYIIWSSMRARCTNPKHKHYANYGGRGITVCPRWAVFENFLSDMGLRPEGHSLDRLNNDIEYCPANCRWATRTMQNRNSAQNRRVTHEGRTMCLAEWCEELKLPYSRVYMRLFRLNWSVEEALK